FCDYVSDLATRRQALCVDMELQMLEPLHFLRKHLLGMQRACAIHKQRRDSYLVEIAVLTDRKAAYDALLAAPPVKPLAIERELSKLEGCFRSTSVAEDDFKQSFQCAMTEWERYNGGDLAGAGRGASGSRHRDMQFLLVGVVAVNARFHRQETDALMKLRESILCTV
ncbi:unnamed protein product, partial [Symbiodinium microadriaticum]